MSFGGWVGSKANSFVYSLWSTFFLVIGAILLFIGGTASSSGEEWAFFACLGSPLCFIVAVWAWVKSKYHASVVPTVGGRQQQVVYVQQPMAQQMQYRQPVQYRNPYNTSNLCNTTSLREKNVERACYERCIQ